MSFIVVPDNIKVEAPKDDGKFNYKFSRRLDSQTFPNQPMATQVKYEVPTINGVTCYPLLS